MPNLNQLLKFEYEIEYNSEYDLPVKKNYSDPKIYDANGNLSKRWYVYYSFRDPSTGKLKKQAPIYAGANSYNSITERLSILKVYQRNLLKLLKEGYSPYLDNQELYNQQPNNSQVNNSKGEDEQKTIKEVFDFVMAIKKQSLSHTSFRGLNNRVNNFLDWLTKNRSELKYIQQLNKKVVTEFLNFILTKSSPGNRNNFRTDLSSVIQIIEDNEIITSNFVKSIPVLKSTPTRNKTYTEDLQKEIYNYLEKHDPLLLLYIKFISYNFLRPIEVCRLKVKDLNIKERKLHFKAKNSPLKTKIIPEILINDLPDLSTLEDDNYLFTPDKIGGIWETELNNRRDYFSKRFKKAVKDHFNLGKDYGLYSFRHTFITKLYYKLKENSTSFEAKSKLMTITGHSTMTALDKYLRTVDADLPEDYSKMLK